MTNEKFNDKYFFRSGSLCCMVFGGSQGHCVVKEETYFWPTLVFVLFELLAIMLVTRAVLAEELNCIDRKGEVGFCCIYDKVIKAEIVVVPDEGDGVMRRDRTLTPYQEQLVCGYLKQLKEA